MKPQQPSFTNKDRYRRCKSIDPGFHGRSAHLANFKNRRPRKNNFHFNNGSNKNDGNADFPNNFHFEPEISNFEEDVKRKRIEELEQQIYEAELSNEKAECDLKAEKMRANDAEKQIKELQSHIAQLIAIQKEKDGEFAEYKNVAEYYISKSDCEKEQAFQWAEKKEKELIDLQRSFEYLQQQFDEEKVQAVKDEEKKIETIKRTQAQCRRFLESLKIVEEKNEKLDLEIMECRKNLVNAEEKTTEIYQSIKRIASQWKDLKGKSKERALMKKLFKDLKKTKKSLKQLKNSLSPHLPDQSTSRISEIQNRQIHVERPTIKSSHPKFFGFPLTMKHTY
uniref:Uncharacterized protein n=1 Tax=Panagrolaimus sp. PS1159 TaxID=55785 RepID=A0AC35FC15_9BILA